MKKRFVVSLASSNPLGEKAFAEWVTDKYAWWHWVKTIWLIVDDNGSLTAESVRNKLKECFPGVHNLVIEIRADGTENYAGVVPSDEVGAAQEWLNNWWKW